MADLDRFKTTNDRYGHVAGDRVIVESVAGVVSAVRDDDLVGRVGGDEFMVCLRGISSHLMVEAVAQRMCAAVREAAEASDDDHGPVSISLGIALYPQDGVTYEEPTRPCTAPSARAAAPTRSTATSRRRPSARRYSQPGFPTPPCSMVSSSPWRSNTPTLR